MNRKNLQYIKPFKLMNYSELELKEQRTLLEADKFISIQSDIWHLNSPKKVSATLYAESLDKIFVGQNIGISKVTGTLCAERAAVANAVSSNPSIKFNDIRILAVVGESVPILPCGVCCEWLYKINPDMIMLTYDKNRKKVIRIILKDYYWDENLIFNRRILLDEA